MVRVPGFGADSLPPMEAILAAFAEGRSVVADGPFVEIGLDRDGDGDWYEPEDGSIGDRAEVGAHLPEPLAVRWASLPEFGPIVSVVIVSGDATGRDTVASFGPASAGDGFGGSSSIDLGTFGYEGKRFFRAEARTEDAASGHRA